MKARLINASSLAISLIRNVVCIPNATHDGIHAIQAGSVICARNVSYLPVCPGYVHLMPARRRKFCFRAAIAALGSGLDQLRNLILGANGLFRSRPHAEIIGLQMLHKIGSRIFLTSKRNKGKGGANKAIRKARADCGPCPPSSFFARLIGRSVLHFSSIIIVERAIVA